MHHPTPVRVVKIIAGIIQRTVLTGSAVQMHDEDPLETLLAKVTR
jgi:hypothetical protein